MRAYLSTNFEVGGSLSTDHPSYQHMMTTQHAAVVFAHRSAVLALCAAACLAFTGCWNDALPVSQRATDQGQISEELATPIPVALAAAPASAAALPPADSPDLWTRSTGADWPQFLGPTSDGKSTETGITTDWSNNPLSIVWSLPVGTSYGIGAVASGRYFQHERVGDVERLRAVRAESGEPLWHHNLPVRYSDMYGYNNGPRDTPAVAGDDVVTFGVAGRLSCRSTIDGKLKWTVDTNEKYGVIQNFFGVGCSPLIHNDLVIVMVGGSPPEDASLPPGRLDRVSPNGTALVAFDLATGKERWRAGDDLASYSSPRLMTLQATTVVLIFAREGLWAFEADTGKQLWHYPHRARSLESVNAMVPVVSENRVLISECYEIGAVLLEVSLDGCQVVWEDPPNRRQQSLRAHWATPILIDGWLYGCSGRNEPDSDLRCLAWENGRVAWSDNRRSRCSVMYVDGHLVALDESGLLQVLKIDPERLNVVASLELDRPAAGRQPLGRPYWAAPIMSHGLLYVRGSDRVLCVELIPDRS
jgi:outer membrane protein assembly factor BamB